MKIIHWNKVILKITHQNITIIFHSFETTVTYQPLTKSENSMHVTLIWWSFFSTGKTVTLVEAIKQVEKSQTSCHILACASCNSAADQLCQEIIKVVDKRKVYRMYAYSVDPKCVPEQLKVSDVPSMMCILDERHFLQ